MLVKVIPIIFQIGIKLKKHIAIYKSPGKSNDQYIYKHHANFQDSIGTQSRALGFYIRVPGEIKRSRDLRGGRWSWTRRDHE